MNIGVDLGGSHIAIGVINKKNNIVKRYEKDFSQDDKSKITEVISNYIVQTVCLIIKDIKQNNENEVYSENECINIGIAAPGIIKNGEIIKSVNLGIKNWNIEEEIKLVLNNNLNNFIKEKKEIKGFFKNKLNANDVEFNINIKVKNDLKCAAIAEYKRMTDNNEIPKNSNMLFLGIGTGIGGAYIYQGKLLTGNNYDGTEFGHMVIEKNGIECKCGKKGCFEKYGSIFEFKNRVKQRLKIDQNINSSPLRDIMNSRMNEIEDLKQEYIKNLAIGISNLINIFEPDVVVIGGGFTHFDYMFMSDLKKCILSDNLLFNERNDMDLRTAKFGNDAGMIGSIME